MDKALFVGRVQRGPGAVRTDPLRSDASRGAPERYRHDQQKSLR